MRLFKLASPLFMGGILGIILLFPPTGSLAGEPSLKEACFYRKLGDNETQCLMCPRRCLIPEGARGVCRNRENRSGTLFALTYGRPCSIAVEPIEKAPFWHFIPGHKRLCVATVGCNLRCKYCQNWHISQKRVEEVRHYNLSPEEVVKIARREGVKSICFTFSEPTAFYEYMYDIAKLAKENGLMSSMVSNGFINPEPLRKLTKVLDAVKIDLKGFSEDFYEKVCFGRLGPVLNTLRILKEEGTWLEIVNLIVPPLNDDPNEIEKMCEWIKKNLGDEVPLHFIRFFPNYKLTHLPPTPVETLEKAIEIAQGVGLKYVYIGNVPGHKYNFTYCPKCGRCLIKRVVFFLLENNIVNGRCKFCGEKIPGLWGREFKKE